jgi:UDP-sugar pyrophosphorylase
MSWFGSSNSGKTVTKAQYSNGGAILPYLEEVIPSTITEKQRALVISLCSRKLRQSHLFKDWSPNTDEALKQDMVEELEFLDESYSDGLSGYILKAREMLKKNKEDVNLMDGWKASVPVGHAYELGTKEYAQMEKLGKSELGKVGFVLVAGGVGDRLGSSNIKLGLPVELATETCYLEHYIRYILAAQGKYAQKGFKLPLCIMTSSDTYEGTIKLLEDNEYFGMEKDQITIVQQGDGVPALMNNDASIAMESPYKVMTKPHGHGDIHALMYNHNIAKDWVKNGIKWITFFQDNNGLAFFTLPLALGVSNKSDLIMNSLVIPRKAGQAVGVIAKLTKEERYECSLYNALVSGTFS